MGIADSLSANARALWNRVQSIFPNARLTSGQRDYVPPGGSKTSQHKTGDAFDFVVPGVDPKTVQATLSQSLGLPFGQSIAEYGLGMGPRNHLSTGSKGQLMTANNGAYRTTGYAPQRSGAELSTDGAGYGREALKQMLGDGWGNWISDGLGGDGLGGALTAPAEAIESLAPDWNAWFQRIALGVFALIFIAAAVFAFKGGDAINMISSARKAS